MQDNKVSRWNLVGAIALAVLVYSGQLGASPLLSWLPVNVTVLTGAIVTVTLLVSLLHYRNITPWAILPMGLWVLFCIPAAQYVSGSYAQEKLTTLLTVGFLCVLAPFQLLRFKIQRVAFLATLAIVALLSSVVIFQSGDTAAIEAGLSADVVLLEGANTIGTARIVGTGALVFVAVALVAVGAKPRRLLFMGLGLALIVIMIATGSRGPLAGIIAGIAALIAVAPALQRRRFRSLFLLVLASIAAYFWSESRGFVSSDRAFAWLTGERDTSTQARQYLWDIAAKYVLSNQAGTGWGGFSTLDGVAWHHLYPHNLILELYVETGWLIGTVALGFIFCSMWQLVAQAKGPVACAILALAVFACVNALVSGDINDNRLLWILLAAAWVPLSTEATQPTRHNGRQTVGSNEADYGSGNLETPKRASDPVADLQVSEGKTDTRGAQRRADVSADSAAHVVKLEDHKFIPGNSITIRKKNQQ